MMQNKMAYRLMSRILVTGLVVSVALVSPVTAASQTPANPSQSALAVSPAIMEQVVTPGVAQKFTVRVSNITPFPLPIKSSVRGFSLVSTDLEKTEQSRLNSSGWFEITDPDFILQPKQVRQVSGTIHPPADATPGGHYATMYFQPLVPAEALTPSTAYLSAKVGVLTLLVVRGDIEQQAAFQDTLHTQGMIRRGPARFSFSIHNSGNVHLQPSGKLVITSGDKQVGTVDVPAGVILPDSTKKYELEWNVPRAVGKYTAQLQLDYGDDTAPQLPKMTVTFWVMPWLEMLIGAVLAGATGLFVWKTHGRMGAAWRVLRGRDQQGSKSRSD